MLTKWVILLVTIFVIACQPSGSDSDTLFLKGEALGTNNNKRLKEASGLVASARYPGYLWTHNDSGHPADLFLLDSIGQTRAEFQLAKIKNRDWEDISMGPGPGDANYIYLGDIGDNNAQYQFKYLYRLKEPDLDQLEELHEVDTLVVKLDGEIHDTETLMIDPITKNIYIVTKREKNVGLYEIIFPFQEDTLIASRIATLPLKQIVAGDISPDGGEILLKNYNHIYYWRRPPGMSIGNALMAPHMVLPYERESAGESIAWAYDGSGFFTLGENIQGDRAKLYFYKRRQQLPADTSRTTSPIRP